MESPLFGTPYGNPVVIRPANPAAGDNFSIIVPPRRIWRIRSLRFSLTTDSTAANRRVVLTTDDDAIISIAGASSVDQIASDTQWYNFSLNPLPEFSFGNDSFIPLMDMLIDATDSLESLISNIQAGDQIATISLSVEEWIAG